MLKDDEHLRSIEFYLLAQIFFYYCGRQILQPGMQVAEYHLSLIDQFLEFGHGHHKHKLLVDILPSSPLEPDCLNEH